MAEEIKGEPVCRPLCHWGAVSRTALLQGFRLLFQILLPLSQYSPNNNNKCVFNEVTAVQREPKPQIKQLTIQLYHQTRNYKSVFVACWRQTAQSCKALRWDQISSFRNHLHELKLAVNRKLLHSLRVYYRSEDYSRAEMSLDFLKTSAEKGGCSLQEGDKSEIYVGKTGSNQQ